MRVLPGSPDPLGATWDGEGVNFALFSEHATCVRLCIFDHGESEELQNELKLPHRTHGVWHGYFPDLRPGQRYGYRVDGPHRPEQGYLFNPNKLLLDPYAHAIDGPLRWHGPLSSHSMVENAEAPRIDTRDSATVLPRCTVVDPAFVWGDDHPLRTPWNRTVIYECHVKGLTMLHPEVPEKSRGTFLGLASEPIIDHLLSLGVTALELLPVQQSFSEEHLVRAGLTNYWGYSPIGFFAPDERFAATQGLQVEEFKSMVKRLHRAGIEVILDVVYNHTGEGSSLGPMVSFRGIDNTSYYRLDSEDPQRNIDYSGCGNSLEYRNPRAMRLIMDSLRYWVTEMHVDGFRFDLATTMARQEGHFDARSNFLSILQQDPVLSKVKLIAEPWDLGHDGYQLGNFPRGFREWNDRYRDMMRSYWRGDHNGVAELASRLSGSSDLFKGRERTTQASINFITSHDGFTLRDLVTYEHKHNEANGEENRDGTDNNLSHNWGAEGVTDKPRTCAIRDRITRNLLATLAFSQGVPMLTQGDEMGRTQGGNNNAYCQDNPISWVRWKLDACDRSLLDFTRMIFRWRRENSAFHLAHFMEGEEVGTSGLHDVTWLLLNGGEMTASDWHDKKIFVLGMLVNGAASDEVNAFGTPIPGRTYLLLTNAGARTRRFRLPATPPDKCWRELVNTARDPRQAVHSKKIALAAHSLILLEHREEAR